MATLSTTPKIKSFTTTGATAYATGQTLATAANHVSVIATGNAAMLSFDGGATDALAVATDHPTQIDGAIIPARTVITVRDMVPGSHFTRVDFSYWTDVAN